MNAERLHSAERLPPCPNRKRQSAAASGVHSVHRVLPWAAVAAAGRARRAPPACCAVVDVNPHEPLARGRGLGARGVRDRPKPGWGVQGGHPLEPPGRLLTHSHAAPMGLTVHFQPSRTSWLSGPLAPRSETGASASRSVAAQRAGTPRRPAKRGWSTHTVPNPG